MRAIFVTLLSIAALAHKQITDIVEDTLVVSEPAQDTTVVEATVEVKKDFNWFIMTY
jgi:hypothetical protein